jgi:hypothetical protein
VASLRVSANADTLADPDRAGPQHAPQLAGLRQVKPLMRPQSEVLVIPRQGADAEASAVSMYAGPPIANVSLRRSRDAGVRHRKPVIWIRPDSRLRRILAGRANSLR